MACYNRLKKNTKKVEYDLIAGELKEIDLQLERAEHALNWNSEGLWFQLCFGVWYLVFGILKILTYNPNIPTFDHKLKSQIQ